MFPNERKALTPSFPRRGGSWRPPFPDSLFDFVIVKRSDLSWVTGGGLRLSEREFTQSSRSAAHFVSPSGSRFDIIENSTW